MNWIRSQYRESAAAGRSGCRVLLLVGGWLVWTVGCGGSADSYESAIFDAQDSLMMERFDETITAATRAMEANPLAADPYLLRGKAYIAKKDYAAALTDLDRAIELNPRLQAAYYGRIEVHTAMNQRDKALADQRVLNSL